MPSGHTDRKTINARKPLTDRMASVLRSLRRGPLTWSTLTQGDQNALRGLFDRGLAQSDDSRVFTITADGLERSEP